MTSYNYISISHINSNSYSDIISDTDSFNDEVKCYICDNTEHIVPFIYNKPKLYYEDGCLKTTSTRYALDICQDCYTYNNIMEKEKEREKEKENKFFICRSSKYKELKCDICNYKTFVKMNAYNAFIYDDGKEYEYSESYYDYHNNNNDSTQIYDKNILFESQDIVSLVNKIDYYECYYIATQELMICDKCNDFYKPLHDSKTIAISEDENDLRNIKLKFKIFLEKYKLNKERKIMICYILNKCLNKDITEYILTNFDINL